MSTGFQSIIHLPSPDETCRLARLLSPILQPGDVLLLEGNIGAGKTLFARALIQARLAANGLLEDVPSPTFTLVQTYHDGIAEIWHADLYRLTDVQDIHELGLEDAFHSSICLVEWPDRLNGFDMSGALWLKFATTQDPEERILTVRADTGTWARLQLILSDFSQLENVNDG